MLLRLPGDEVVTEEEEDAGGALPRINVTCLIAITVAEQTGLLLLLPLVLAAIAEGPRDVPEDPLDCPQMLGGQVFHVPTHIAH